MRRALLLLVLPGLLAACTGAIVSGRTVKDGTPAGPPISRIALEFTPAARRQTDADERFNPELLREAIAAELRSRQLLDTAHPESGRALVIQLEEFEVRPTSNVVMFGRLPSAGVLGGVARLRARGGEAQEFRVRADVAMQVSRKTEEKNPLKALYRGFAEQFVATLAGVAK